MAADLEGASTLSRTLEAAAAEIRDLDLEGVARPLQAEATEQAPYRTGALASTVRATHEGGIVSILAGGPGVDYAAAVHKRNPWIARIVTDNETRILEEATAEVDAALARVEGT